MEKTNILFVHQEITPYITENPMSLIGRYLPQGIQERGREIRTFMPVMAVLMNEETNYMR